MSYAVKELFYTLQGEGANAGRPSVFCRFAGCNLWSGREQDRDKAVCWFCDTDFVGTDGTGGGNSPPPRPWPMRYGGTGRTAWTANPSWSVPAASRCCNWMRR
jgi:organic radical activating enzyme